LQVGVEALQACAERQGIAVSHLGDDVDIWLDLLLSHVIEPQLAEISAGQTRLVFVYDYPPSQASLARINPQGLAERFELYLNGIELANGYHELGDAEEQRRRLEHDNTRRRAMGKVVMPADECLLAALESGLPDCAGVALGLDRLIMCAAGVKDLRQVLAFSLAESS
jgi:lysyl-tRNA synthetase class 2